MRLSLRLAIAALWFPMLSAHAYAAEKTPWGNLLAAERREHSTEQFVETGVSGLATFLIGTYGSLFNKDGEITSGVYSLLQTGGILIIGEAIQSYMETSPHLVVDQVLRKTDGPRLEREYLRRSLLAAERRNEKAFATSNLFTWSSLAVLYATTALREPKKASTSRSIYYFLSVNAALLAAASGYSLFSLPDTSLSLAVIPQEQGPTFRLALSMDIQ